MAETVTGLVVFVNRNWAKSVDPRVEMPSGRDC